MGLHATPERVREEIARYEETQLHGWHNQLIPFRWRLYHYWKWMVMVPWIRVRFYGIDKGWWRL